MEKTVAEMTTRELELQDSLWKRLLQQRKDVAAGERGKDLNEVARRLGLA